MMNHSEVTDETPSRSLGIDAIIPGQSVWQHVVFDEAMMDHFAAVARDRAPVHHDPRFAVAAGFDRPIIQGLALAGRFSRLIGMYLPGERAILERIDLKYKRPSFVGEVLHYKAVVERVWPRLGTVRLNLSISSNGRDHVLGVAQCLVR